MRDVCLPGLLDPVMHPVPQPEGQRRKASGQARAIAADSMFCQAATNAAMRLVKRGGTFTSDDLWRELADFPQAELPARANAIGAIFSGLVRQGLIAAADFTTTSRPEGQGRVIRVWQVVA
jgi:hypothetical protein